MTPLEQQSSEALPNEAASSESVRQMMQANAQETESRGFDANDGRITNATGAAREAFYAGDGVVVESDARRQAEKFAQGVNKLTQVEEEADEIRRQAEEKLNTTFPEDMTQDPEWQQNNQALADAYEGIDTEERAQKQDFQNEMSALFADV